jgi:subtilisin family serine protease
MKKYNYKLIFATIITFLFCIKNVYAQSPYYYYQETPIYLTQTKDKMFVKFVSNANKMQIISLINANNNIKLVNAADSAVNKISFLLFEGNNQQNIPSTTFANFKANTNVMSVMPIFEYNGALQGLTDEFIVKLKATTSYVQLQTLATTNNCVIKEENPFVQRQYIISVPKSSILNALQTANLFYETGLFEFSEPNFVIINAFNSNDTYYGNQYNLHNIGQNGGVAGIDINAPEAWNISTGSGIRVAVVDQGVDLTHPDLISNIVAGYDASGNNSGGAPVWDTDNHGTACAGIIGASKDNNEGIAGVAPNCKIISIHTSSSSGLPLDWAINSINWAWQNGNADVISNSWGGFSPTTSLANAINDAATQGRNGLGCVVVFSAGNNNATTVGYPGRLPNVIAVGAISPCGERKRSSSNANEVNSGVTPDPQGVSCDGEKGWGSNYGNELDVVAPGVLIPTTDRQGNAGYTNNNYRQNFNGTSSACPHVAGVAALILSVNPNLTGQQVRNIIEQTAQKVRQGTGSGQYNYQTNSAHPNGTWHEQMGYGLVDAYEAVLAAQATLPHSDLLIRDEPYDNGTEPYPFNIDYQSPDIWLANENFINLSNWKINYLYLLDSVYVAVRIKNIGNIPSSTDSKLHIYWSKVTVNSVWKNSWINNSSSYKDRGEITPPDGIEVSLVQPGESIVKYYKWKLPSLVSGGNTPVNTNWGFAILARIDDGNETRHLKSTMEPSSHFARENNNVAICNSNLSIFQNNFSRVIAIEPVLGQSTFSLAQTVKEGGYKLSDFAELYVILSNDLMQILDKNGVTVVNENMVRVNSDVAELNFAPMREDGVYFIGTEVHFISDKMPELNDFEFDLAFKTEDKEPEILRFSAVRDDVFFKAEAEASSTKVVRGKEETVLTSNKIADDAKYVWYNEAGSVIGENDQTLAPLATQKYTVEITKNADGFKSYDEVAVVVVDGAIVSLSPNPASGYLKVEYKLSDYATSVSLQISDIQQTKLLSYPLSLNADRQEVSLLGLPSGNYFVKLLVNGAVADTKTIIKQ